MERHYGMDWLRIGAFGLLIFYHIGMVFVPWGFSVKTAQPIAWAEIPMFLTSPWRLTLLFLVSGFASRALFAKMRGAGEFIRGRSARLLIPLLFGMAVIVPPQAWVELATQHGYTHGYLHFWLHDYFRFGTLSGIVLPTYNHLWFVFYLWTYSLGLAALRLIPAVDRGQAVFDRIFAGWRALVIPAAYFVILQAVLFHRPEYTHDFVNDGVAHLRYIPAFLFGFGLARSQIVQQALANRWATAAAIAACCWLTIAGLLIAYPDFSFPDGNMAVLWTYRIARHLETWMAIAALTGAATRYWNSDHPWRAMLAEAVFPFYIIHQTVIVVVGGWLLPLHPGPLYEFAILVLATIAGCWAFYLVGRSLGPLRPLVGLKRADRPSWLPLSVDPVPVPNV
jgi:glucan biosynthesis protein C